MWSGYREDELGPHKRHSGLWGSRHQVRRHDLQRKSIGKWMGDARGLYDVREWDRHYWQEPIYHEGYNEDEPFPTWKPDIDVLGVPPRQQQPLRRQ